jgi:hypothetical protein
MKSFLAIVFCLIFWFKNSAQTNLIFSSFVTPGIYTNQQKITLLPGMHTNGTAGNSRLYIDPNISLNSNFASAGTYGTSNVTYNLDISKPVGSIPYSYNVTPIGSAEIDVPINCPLGTNNMMPSISLHYSSFTSIGELGAGWGITGLQKITRIGNTIYNNGFMGGMKLNNSDNFALNGNRLISQSGTGFFTEQNTFSRIIPYGSTGNGPSYFVVETKDGLTLEFGNSPDSKLVPTGSSTIYEWNLNKVTDVSGNYMTYEYFNNSGDVLIKEIAYTGNPAVTAPYNFVRFYYNSKPEKNTQYIGGGAISSKSIIRQIEVKQENNLVAQYNFNYVTYFNNSYLTEISQKGSDFSTLNSLKFSYHNDTGAPSLKSTTGLNLNASGWFSKHLFLDFTGDGKKDAISIDYTAIYNGTTSYICNGWRTLKNNGTTSTTNFTQLGSTNSFPGGYVPINDATIIKSQGAVGNYLYSIYDFNGDNKEDFVLVNSTGTNADIFVIYISNGTGFNAPHILSVAKVPKTSSSAPDNQYWFMDLDGDSKLDLLYSDNVGVTATNLYTPGFVAFYAVLNVAQSGNVGYNNNNNANLVLGLSDVKVENTRIVDLKANGKASLLITNYNGAPSNYKIIELNNSNVLTVSSLPASNAFISIDHPNYYTAPWGFTYKSVSSIGLEGDYNGDGTTDFITSTYSSGGGGTPINYKFELFFSKGDGTFTNPILLNKAGLGLHNFTDAGVFYYTADMNGDAKTDIVEASQAGLKIYFSKGNDGADYFFSESYAIGTSAYFDIIDIDGNGINDIVKLSAFSSQTSPEFIFFYKGEKSKNLRELVDPIGKNVSFVYAPLTDPNVYSQTSPGNSQSHPLCVLNAPMYVVDEVKTPNGIGGISSTKYQYENGIVHKLGKGLLCFTKITKTNTSLDSRIIDEFSFEPNKFYPYKTKSSVYADNLNQLLKDEVYSNSHFNYGTFCYYPFVISTTEHNYLQNYSVYSQSSPDADGNITYLERNVSSGLDREQSFYSGFVSNGSWLPCKPTAIYKVTTRSGQNIYDGNTQITYNSDGSIQKIIEEPSDPKRVEKDFAYDASTGALISKTMYSPGSGLQNKTASYLYDSKFRFIIQETNSLSQVSKTKYNYMWGKPTEIQGFNGLKTIYTYDGYGRSLTVKYPDNTTSTNSYQWVSSGDFNGLDPLNVNTCVYKVFNSKSGEPTKGAYYDMFDREIRTEFEGFNGSKHFTMVQYDGQGHKTDETGTYQLTSGNPLNTIQTLYSYDY